MVIKIAKSPLEGLIVIDFATLIAAPIVASFLGDFGAEVIKVEQPKIGDPNRATQIYTNNKNPAWLDTARNKKTITLDLHKSEGREIAKLLIQKADVVLFNFRPGILEKWDLNPNKLHEFNPDLIICLVTAYGQTGPKKSKGGFDRTVSAYAGITYTSGYAEHPPVRTRYPLVDFLTGYLGAFAVMTALYNRDVNNKGGEIIDLSLAEAAFVATGGSLSRYSVHKTIEERTGNRISFFVPAENFETCDGKIITFNAGTEKLWQQLVIAMNKSDLLENEKFKTYIARISNQDELYEIIGNWIKNKTSEEVIEILDNAGVPCERINSIADIVNDSHLWERKSILEFADDKLGKLFVKGIIPKFKNYPGSIRFLGAGLGEYNNEVYQNLIGLSLEEIEKLKENEII
jgi:crotonobetainyl-CoA:carnitine CoA-transferase CaiB-like acyl-CoA transferase